VHAWQDATSIRCAIAGLIVGVPRLVLSARNVNPTNFDYGQPYMRRRIERWPSWTTLFSRTTARGADDYARWPACRARGSSWSGTPDLNRMRPAPEHAVAAYCAQLGIPGLPAVGSVFRFWEEKRPMLWLEVAARCGERAAAHFLLIGDGTALLRDAALRPQSAWRRAATCPGRSGCRRRSVR
jgi:hypothetical protein